MLIKTTPTIPGSEITDEKHYLQRRDFIRLVGGAAMIAGAAPWLQACAADPAAADFAGTAGPAVAPGQTALANVKPKVITTTEQLNSFADITSYNNFYEFGTAKNDPQQYASALTTSPWKVKIDGHCAKPADYHLEDILKPHQLEERIYRLRCVEGWSMVIPWMGFPMSDLINRVQPLASAKFIEFQTLFDPKQMPGQRSPVLNWPYTEGLRLDEAMHPLAIFGVGLYGKTLLPQNGAPLRTVIPWKYGFKATKSIVRIRFTDKQPRTAWNDAAPNEYGFLANVNPEVDHPRWSQARERRIGEFRKRPTLMFNGYADQVSRLYSGVDLRKNY